MPYPRIHEDGDEFLRPTSQPWKCPNCRVKLFTADCILSHKKTCIKTCVNKDTRLEEYENQRKIKLQESLRKLREGK